MITSIIKEKSGTHCQSAILSMVVALYLITINKNPTKRNEDKMARKTDEERLQELEKKIEQAKAKKLQIERRMKEKERKERTRRLIQVGAIFEYIMWFAFR